MKLSSLEYLLPIFTQKGCQHDSECRLNYSELSQVEKLKPG